MSKDRDCFVKSGADGLLGRFRRGGFTLVEVMLALLILSILVIGGMTFVAHSSGTIAQQNNKRAAISAANRRMELVRSVPYTTFTDEWEVGSSPVYLEYNYQTDEFSHFSENPWETVLINGKSRNILTKVRLVNSLTFSGLDPVQCVEIEVRVNSGANGTEDVVLLSYYSN